MANRFEEDYIPIEMDKINKTLINWNLGAWRMKKAAKQVTLPL